jgi:hypothetical protein
LSTKLKLNVHRSFLPFFAADILDYDPREEAQKTRAAYEPLVVMFLRLCYWYHKCDIITSSLASKNKEVRDKLKVSNSLLDLIRFLLEIRRSGFNTDRLKEWMRQAIGVVYELICASLSHDCHQSISFQKRHDFILEKSPAEVKTKFPPIDTRLGEEFYPLLNARLQDSEADLEHVLIEAIKVPDIMTNNLKPAVERQDGKIIFLNIILENQSSVLRFLSDYKRLDLTIQNAIDRAARFLTDESSVPLVISFHTVHCNYEIYALTVSIPVKKENGKAIIDQLKL